MELSWFQSIWITHHGLRDFISNSWAVPLAHLHPMQILGYKLKRLRGQLRIWNRDVCSHLKINIDRATSILQSIQGEIETHGFSDALHKQELEAYESLDHYLHQQEIFLKEKHRVCWLKADDRNSNFFPPSHFLAIAFTRYHFHEY